MGFPPLSYMLEEVNSEYERESIEVEYGVGLDYYLSRLDTLVFCGEKVLDAGCGAGQWAIALSRRFREVAAIDLRADRLAVLARVSRAMGVQNIDSREGSIEQLPYAAGTFDAVFCYGVIMFTRVERVLAEFHRVLKPGGRAYVCLNADGWSQYLIHERGRTNESVSQMGRNSLYKTYWHRAADEGLLDDLKKAGQRVRGVLGYLLRWGPIRRQVIGMALCAAPAGRRLIALVTEHCGPAFVERLYEDARAVCLNIRDVMAEFSPERVYQPEELERRVREAGFVDFEYASEAGLLCNWLEPAMSPRYEGDFQGVLSVWESVFRKPAAVSVTVKPALHYEAARAAARTPVYQEPLAAPLVSNGSRWTYPRGLLEHAVDQARAYGGREYLRHLAQTVTSGAATEEEAVRRLFEFVQRSLFRDPVAQPLTAEGALPDAEVILFCSRGRCGHAARLVIDLANYAGLDARLLQLAAHVVAEVKAEDRWVLVDADTFKNGVIPVNRQGRLPTLEDLMADPYQLDRFPATGWYLRPNTRWTAGILGEQVRGYVDALEPDQRGFVSGYFVPAARGFPPRLPRALHLEAHRDCFRLQWSQTTVKHDALLGYQVRVGTTSRGWTYEDFGVDDAVLRDTPADVLSVQTRQTCVEGSIPPEARRLYASVTPFSSRIDKEPRTHFQPSEEVSCEV